MEKAGSAVEYLVFADNLALLANDREAQEMLEKLHKIAEKTRLKISYEKQNI